jgi:hypothetical protein
VVGRFIWVGDCLCSNHNNLIINIGIIIYTNIDDMYHIHLEKSRQVYKETIMDG